jgi:hypothetical protein
MTNLLKVTLIISLTGIFLLLCLANFIQHSIVNISSITENQIDREVKISGQVTSSKIFEDSDFQIINLKDKTGNISITIDTPVNISKNQTLTITGKIIEYKDNLEMRAEKISLIFLNP